MVARTIDWSSYTASLVPKTTPIRLVLPEPSALVITDKYVVFRIFELHKDSKTCFPSFRFFFEVQINRRIAIGIHWEAFFFKQGWFFRIVIMCCRSKLIVANTIFFPNGNGSLLLFLFDRLPLGCHYLRWSWLVRHRLRLTRFFFRWLVHFWFVILILNLFIHSV